MFYGLAGILSALATAFFWWRHAGPYRWIADLQHFLWGVNVLQVSLLLCWAALYVPLHLVVHGVELPYGRKTDPLAWRRLVALFAYLTDGRAGQTAMVGILIFGMGVWFLIGAATSGPLTTLSVAEAEAGRRPASRHVRLLDARVIMSVPLTYTRNGHDEHYYPVVSENDANEPERLTVFVRFDGAAPPRQIEGELEFDGLPGALRAQLDDRNVLAPGYFVVRDGQDPERQVPFLAGMCGFGVLVFVGGVVWARRKRRAT